MHNTNKPAPLSLAQLAEMAAHLKNFAGRTFSSEATPLQLFEGQPPSEWTGVLTVKEIRVVPAIVNVVTSIDIKQRRLAGLAILGRYENAPPVDLSFCDQSDLYVTHDDNRLKAIGHRLSSSAKDHKSASAKWQIAPTLTVEQGVKTLELSKAPVGTIRGSGLNGEYHLLGEFVTERYRIHSTGKLTVEVEYDLPWLTSQQSVFDELGAAFELDCSSIEFVMNEV
jgi:hypothetical protein